MPIMNAVMCSPHLRGSPAPTLSSNPSLKVGMVFNPLRGNEYTNTPTPRALPDSLGSPFSSFREQDPSEELSASTPLPNAVIESPYGRNLPMFFYKTGNSSSTSQNFQYQTPVTSLGSLPVSPTSSIRTRPLFLPSPSVQIGQYAETSDEAPTRKRKERPEYSFDSPARCSKRRYTEPEVIDIDDDDNWHSAFANTGYQDARRPRFSVESSIAHSEDEEDSGSQFSTNTHRRYRSVYDTPRLAWRDASSGWPSGVSSSARVLHSMDFCRSSIAPSRRYRSLYDTPRSAWRDGMSGWPSGVSSSARESHSIAFSRSSIAPSRRYRSLYDTPREAWRSGRSGWPLGVRSSARSTISIGV
ncbi:hypothetical protein RSOLAG1IB_11428 [Rhizoctonia solani AG-1 IB]|uniref:Uncharacterized protein n=1 Tax=Thanatephorus cucumeris (strain AG1-IB / isolate 7/3/14) TaxID=1108050 RepID=A0A0B7FBW9_THACB|nr:hypothetical protein RSOLAG1IB_11428 [Rhizoctonia solani AG-1 IB]